VKLYRCGITIDISAIEAPRYLAAGYVKVEEKPVEIPANPQPEASEVLEKPKARKTAMKKGN
jgi:hypothetical protein